MANNFVIKTATADYTGGGVYLFTGELKDGTFFLAFDEWEDDVLILDAPTDSEECFYSDWQEEHTVREEVNKGLYKKILKWIVKHNPEGNYLKEELKERLEWCEE